LQSDIMDQHVDNEFTTRHFYYVNLYFSYNFLMYIS